MQSIIFLYWLEFFCGICGGDYMCFTARVKILSTDVVSHLQVLLCDWNLPYLSTINEMSQVSVADVVVHYLKILGYLRS